MALTPHFEHLGIHCIFCFDGDLHHFHGIQRLALMVVRMMTEVHKVLDVFVLDYCCHYNHHYQSYWLIVITIIIIIVMIINYQ